MQRLTLPFESIAELRAQASREGELIRLGFSGTADLRVAEEVDAILRAVHGSVLGSDVHEVIVDMRDLEFMNSSCFKGFASWISALHGTTDGQRYKIRFLSNRAILWQRRSLHALTCLAPELVSVDASSTVARHAG